MANKKPEKKKSGAVAHVAMGMLKELFNNLVMSSVVDWFNKAVHDIQKTIYNTVGKIMESALAMAMLILGISMVVLSLPFLLSTYLDIPASMFFVLFGLVLMIISLISFHNINKTKYRNHKED